MSLVRTDGRVEVVEMPSLLTISAETIGRDFRALASQGLITLDYGVT